MMNRTKLAVAIPVLSIAAYFVYLYRPDKYVWHLLDVAHKYIEGYCGGIAKMFKDSTLDVESLFH